MKSLLGTEVSNDIRGILYLCELNYDDEILYVRGEIFFKTPFEALNAYANIPNPESQMVSGKTFEELERENESLSNRINNSSWIEELMNCL